MNLLSVLILLGVVIAAYGAVLKRAGMKGLSVARRFSSPTFSAGEEGELIETVINARPLVIPWLRVESHIPDGLTLRGFERRDERTDSYYQSVFCLMPWQKVTRRRPVRFERRGVYQFGNAGLTCGHLIGLTQYRTTQLIPAGVVVFPALLPPDALPEPLERLTGSWILERRLTPDPFLVRGLRDYVPGDPVRDIHWAASARTGRTQLRLYDTTVSLRLLAVLNGEYRESQWDQVSDQEQPLIEYGISLAATLCVAAVRSGMPAGFAANLRTVDGSEAGAGPVEGDGGEEILLTAFARLKTERTLRFASFLSGLSPDAGTDVVVISAYRSEEIDAELMRLRRRGCQVVFHLLRQEVAG